MNKFLSDLYDWAEAGPVEDDKRIDLLERIGCLDVLREHVAEMDRQYLCRIAYDIELNELMNDKEKFVDAVGDNLGIKEITEDCIRMALAVGLVESRGEAMQKYGDSLKELFGLEQ